MEGTWLLKMDRLILKITRDVRCLLLNHRVCTVSSLQLSETQSVCRVFSRRVYKERLGVPPDVIIGYQSHADTATKSSTTTKNKFVA